ncbi:hypothetical protein B0T17DRAFT_538607 [Bombardia bombarda]|uniref:Uncharacterized protein n=1 Tax=Bombardia bombarda TaxID=252184 RepID=A0AA39WHP9_9PEZI|nr:hypothetical protein B0T17DRAFT_538607 [Bombardia bombarda]
MSLVSEQVTALFQKPATGNVGEAVGTLSISNHVENGVDVAEKGRNAWRTENMKQVLAIAQQAWDSRQEKDLALVAEKIADGARDSAWRFPIGETGILDFFLTVIPAQGLDQTLTIQTLRVIGNASADCEENRARVLESDQLRTIIIGFLNDDSLLSFVIPVIYNISVDYDPAQLQICEAGLSSKLVDIISGARLLLCQNSLNIIIRLLELLVSQDAEPKFANPASPALLLSLAITKASQLDLEEFTGLCTVALAYLTYEQFQTAFLESNSFEALQDAFHLSHTKFDPANSDPEVAEQLTQVWNAFETIFADISALPEFDVLYPLDHPVVKRLVAWLGTPASFAHLQTAACLSLGNLARSDDTCLTLIDDVSPDLFEILARAVAPLLGSLLDTILPALWGAPAAQPQVQHTSISLARLLLTSCPANVRRFCAGGATKLQALMALSAGIPAEPTRIEIARVVCAACRTLQSSSASEAEPILSEADWPSTGDDDQEDDTPRARFYTGPHADAVAKALGTLLTQQRFPTIRSEVLFVLALMSRSRDGARMAVRVLQPFAVCKTLVEIVSGLENMMVDGQGLAAAAATAGEVEVGGGSVVGGSPSRVTEVSGDDDAVIVAATDGDDDDAAAAVSTQLVDGLELEPQQVDPKLSVGAVRVNRENGLVLVAEVLRGFGEELSPFRKRVFEEMLSQGGELILEQRKQS